MPIKTNPCAHGLTPECFRAYPRWAKQAFSYRLMNMITPPAISRRLQKVLKGAWVFPGVVVSPDLDPTPGTVILPGPGLPPSDGLEVLPGEVVAPPPIDWTNPPAEGLIPSPFIAPFQPGPPSHAQGKAAPHGTFTFVSETSDGYIWKVDATRSIARTAVTGDGLNKTAVKAAGMCSESASAPMAYTFWRSFFAFDLSSLAAGTVKAVTLTLRGSNFAESAVSVQQGTQAGVLTTADYNAFSGDFFDHQEMALDSVVFTFNAAGLAYIQTVLGATAKLCAREYDKDYLDVNFGLFETYKNGCYFAEEATVAYRPTLSITI